MNQSKSYPYKRMTTILRPDFGQNEKRRPLPIPKLSDYIRVPVVATHGTFNFAECMSFEDLAKLAVMRDKLEKLRR